MLELGAADVIAKVLALGADDMFKQLKALQLLELLLGVASESERVKQARAHTHIHEYK